MKAVAVTNTVPASLHDIEIDRPQPAGRQLLVRIEAVSVNPVDYKQRKPAGEGVTRVLGWDAAGTVVETGPQAQLFGAGDAVYYAGSLLLPGTNSEYHLVDERLAGRKPMSIGFEQAAALPLTTITAWEALFDRLGVARDGSHAGRTLLVVGGAGGVGSIAIQLARKLARLTVIATASRAQSAQWCRSLGADHIVDHHGDIEAQLKALGLPAVDFVLCLNELDKHFPALAASLAPQGKICSIVRNEQPLALELLFAKSATLVFELMFTRSSYQSADMIEQHKLLDEVAGLIDSAVLQSTLGEVGGTINAANLIRAHAALEARRTVGKIVLSGF